jgi:hypothetical protein
MRQAMLRLLLVALAALLVPDIAQAHTEPVTPYLLPLPLGLYLLACGATLAVSFAVVALVPALAGAGPASPPKPSWRLGGPLARSVLLALRAGALASLALVIVAGVIGTEHPLGNVNQPLFWLVFLLGFAYATALIGNLFELINPWKTLVAGAEALGLDFGRPRIAYPERFGYYPAFLCYIALIWLELYILPKPVTLSAVLVVYTLITFAGAWVFGKSAWFEHGEFFSVYFRLIATLAPISYFRAADGWQMQFRRPFAALLETRAEHVSLLLFVLFMLSSTTYDGIHEHDAWIGIFWKSGLALTQPLWGTDLGRAQTMLLPWYIAYQRLGLVLSPFVYLSTYLLALGAMRALTRTVLALRALALQFTFSLVPIAFVYNFTHNLTHFLVEIRALPYLLTDPFGFGWNLFGVDMNPAPLDPIEMGPVWHSQVALMLGGHMVGVYVAHVIALRLFPTRRQAALSQLPLLALMVIYTVIGLSILTLPIKPAAD